MALNADLKALTTLLKALLIKDMKPLNKLSSNSVSLSNFSFFRFYHVSKTQKRSFRGMMSWNILSDSKRTYNNLSTLRVLRAYYYEQRSGANKIGCLDWRLENQPEVEFLRVLASRG